jgi:hypothetical protein
VIRNLRNNLRMLLETVEELSFNQVTNRLACLISQLLVPQLERGRGERLTQDELAAR